LLRKFSDLRDRVLPLKNERDFFTSFRGNKLSSKQRLDTLLVELGLIASREQAQRLIRSGAVQVERTVVDKPGTEVSPTAAIQIKERSPFVSRGGEKLAGALAAFEIDLNDRVGLDGGISTGGFTDCLLKHGAAGIYGVDVGYGQVAWEVRNDPRVVLKERTNLRYLAPEDLYPPDAPRPNFAVLDLSFISVTKVMPALWELLLPPREVLVLVKPQFEAGKQQVGKHGIVKDPKIRAEAFHRVMTAAIAQGWHFRGMARSPIQGKTGNYEYWLWLLDSESVNVSLPTLDDINDLTGG
jgi:23S rRNA (cytidine1920-2'-O)/16S rRNA (cytidine1409-2'-O)-methyltransferase